MRIFLFVLLFFPLLTYASVGDDINALLDRFFGGDQAPLEEIDYGDQTPEPMVGPSAAEPEPLDTLATGSETLEIRREIMQQEAELEAFELSLRAQEKAAAKTRSAVLTSQQQLQLLDEQLSMNQRKLSFYDTQVKEWQALVETLTRDKSMLRAQIRILEKDYQDMLSKKFIQKQNFQLNPTISWWQWMFSDRTVSELLNERRQSSVDQLSQADALANLERLKEAFDRQEMEAVEALSTVSLLEQKLLKDQIVLNDLAEAKASLLQNLNNSEVTAGERLAALRESQTEATRYLQTLRQQLAETPATAAVESADETEVVLNVLSWPLATPVTINAGFKDPQYAESFGREHLGIDLVASQGSDVFAAGDGIVNKIATDSSGYTYLILQHAPDLYTLYGHLSKTLVKVGDAVTTGEVIAWSGGTPGTPGAGFFTSGPHLHFGIFSGGQFVDPLIFLPE